VNKLYIIIFFFQRMVVEMVFNKIIQIYVFLNKFIFLKGKIIVVYIIGIIFKLNFNLVI
jgi:hypothetical protein